MSISEGITIPDGMQLLSPHLVCNGVVEAIAFYQEVFGAEQLVCLSEPDGRIMHASITISGCSVMLVDENLEYGMRGPTALGGSPVTLHLMVADADAVVEAAVAAGAVVRMPVADQFWGDRYGVIEDPWGHQWSIATPGADAPTGDDLVAAMNASFEEQPA